MDGLLVHCGGRVLEQKGKEGKGKKKEKRRAKRAEEPKKREGGKREGDFNDTAFCLFVCDIQNTNEKDHCGAEGAVARTCMVFAS